jgi:hypothetical protein
MLQKLKGNEQSGVFQVTLILGLVAAFLFLLNVTTFLWQRSEISGWKEKYAVIEAAKTKLETDKKDEFDSSQRLILFYQNKVKDLLKNRQPPVVIVSTDVAFSMSDNKTDPLLVEWYKRMESSVQ